MFNKFLLSRFIFLCLTLSFKPLSATTIQLLHTNDLHGFIERSISRPSLGGYSYLKQLINVRKNIAHLNGHEGLLLDAGDFLEGSIFYMANRAQDLFILMDKMGYDCVVMGNHDWLMGMAEKNKILSKVDFQFNYLASNVKLPKVNYTYLKKKIRPYSIYKFNEIKVAIVGLTTNEIFYKWRFRPGKILNPVRSVKKTIKKLKENEKVDFIIALTHLGLKEDIELVKKTDGIDLIIGGHSHTKMIKPKYVKNKSSKLIPIVQAGRHGEYLGELYVDINKGESLKIRDYKLFPVQRIFPDQVVQNYVIQTRSHINDFYGEEYLKEVVGFSEIDLVSSESRKTIWNAFVVDAMKEAVSTDMAVHSVRFNGPSIPKGAISREDIIQSHPRFLDIRSKYGWNIYKIKARGGTLNFLISEFIKRGKGMIFSGITYDLKVNKKGKIKIKNIKINGEKIKFWKIYSVAMPEGIIKGGLGISSYLYSFLRIISKTTIPIWSAIERKLKKDHVIKADYLYQKN